jgi:hypothetical protein
MTVQTLDYEAVPLDTTLTLEQQCEAIWSETIKQQHAEERLRRQRPDVGVHDGEWRLQHVLTQEYEAEVSWIENDTGPGSTSIPFETHVAQWIWDMQSRIDRGEKLNVHLSVEYCGARWCGRLDNATARTTEDGDKVLIVTWLHDYENLKWYSVWCNPWTGVGLQMPRVFTLGGPVNWIGLLSLHLQLIREHNPFVTIPDDPMDYESYLDVLDMSTWHMVAMPITFLEAMASGVVWGIISSRFSNWHDMMKMQLYDAEISVRCTRYFRGDPAPFPGAGENLRHGCLVVDMVDHSGHLAGTSHGGTLWDGLSITAMEFASDFIDSTADLIYDNIVPQEYLLPGVKLTKKEMPYVILREGEGSAIQTGDVIVSPAKGVQVLCGGHSMPGVDEIISATIIAGFGMAGSIIGLGSLGSAIDALVKPMYEGTVLAWMAAKSTARAQHSGWDRYFEYFQEGANKAYTIASLMVLRAGFWATKTTISVQVSIIDASPWTVGDRGLGHFWLGDRIGVSIAGDPRKTVHMEQCTRLDLKWSADSPFAEWTATIGDDRALQDPTQRAWGRIEAIVSAMREMGVY